MKRLPLLLLMVAGGVFLAFNTMGTSKTPPPTKYEKILQIVGAILTQGHYSPQDINDNFSKKVFNKYLENLDPEKDILMKEDIDALRSKYETHIDDEIKGAPVEFFLAAGKVFNQRVEEAATIYKDILSKPFDFKVDETVTLDPKKLTFPSNDAQRREMWRKRLKYQTLNQYVDLLDTREKNKGKDSFVVKTDAELEKEARDKVMKVMDRTFDRYKVKFNDDDKFDLFVNTITQTMDPYTEYFSPVEKRYFDEQLSGSFFGIGASLRYDEGNIKVASVLNGSPAAKSGEIEVGDVITKVAQGSDTAVDLSGFEVEDAVKLIRGQKGTEVKLTLKKKDGTLKTVSLIREKIETDETFARSAIINNGTSKIGYILLPEFYADFEHANGSRSAVDVAKEVTKLKQAGVDGIVIDLRNNGGGSLNDVVQMAGLFIEDGPIVQVKDREGKPTVLKDRDNTVLYSGPLAVMVNEFSASASEIFAAAIQDYHRGVVIGSTSTYGKGSVQRSIGLDPQSNFMSSNSDLGSLKLTLQKFYRINGGSTQLKGVTPDVVIPDQYEYLKMREKDNTNALPWDEISKAPYKEWNGGYDVQTIKNLSAQRINNNPSFNAIKQGTEWLSKQNDRVYSLQLDKYRQEQKVIREAVQKMDTALKLKSPLDVSFLAEDSTRYNSVDKDKKERYEQWLKNLSKDIYVDQAVKVIGDIRSQQALANKKQEVKSF